MNAIHEIESIGRLCRGRRDDGEHIAVKISLPIVPSIASTRHKPVHVALVTSGCIPVDLRFSMTEVHPIPPIDSVFAEVGFGA